MMLVSVVFAVCGYIKESSVSSVNVNLFLCLIYKYF